MAFFKEMEIRTLIVGTGAAGYGAAVRLQQYGERDPGNPGRRGKGWDLTQYRVG